MTVTRRLFGAAAIAVAGTLLAACATSPSAASYPPIVFVHGNGDSAALWQTTLWRFESNGWPAERLHAIDMPYPLARDLDATPQPGRSSTVESADFLKREVEKILRISGADKVVLVGNSRGGFAIRSYLQNGGGSEKVSHAILGGTSNHGVWAIKGFREDSEFSGTGPFLTALNAPKNAVGDEVTGPVRWMTIRSNNNDKFAQPDGLWIGAKGTPTNVTFDGPALKGATNIVLQGVDHRETSFSPAAFFAMHQFITGKAAQIQTITSQNSVALSGKLMGLGLNPLQPATGNYANNLPLPGAQLDIYATDTATGARLGASLYSKTVSADGLWGPFTAKPGTAYEFAVQASGYAVTHVYRSAFARSSSIVNVRAERLTDTDKAAAASITLTRPRGYFDAQRDQMMFDGLKVPPGVPATGAGVSNSKILLPTNAGTTTQRAISAEFNGEKITGQTWPTKDDAGGHATMLELTY